MALKIDSAYPGDKSIPADTNYPWGSWKNISVPGGQDGTPYEKKWANDIAGLLQRLLKQANITPSQVSDTVLLSDYMDSLQRIFPLWLTYSDTGTADNYQLATISGSTVNEYTDGMVVVFKPLNTNTGASVVQIESLGTRDVTYYDGTPLQSGALLQNKHSQLVYNLSSTRFELVGISSDIELIGKNLISGLVPSNSGGDLIHDIVFGVGAARAQNASIDIALVSPLIKQIDSPWAPGNNAGGRLSPTFSAFETFHLYVFLNSSTAAVDCGFSSLINPTSELPSGYDIYRRIGSVVLDNLTNIRRFVAREIAGGALHVNYLPRILTKTFPSPMPIGRQIHTLEVPTDISPIVELSLSLEFDTPITLYLLVMPTDEILDAGQFAYTVELNAGNTGDTTQFECIADNNAQVAWSAKPDAFVNTDANMILKGYLDRRVN